MAQNSNTTVLVQKRPDGLWEAIKPRAARASAVEERQQDAIVRAFEIAGRGPVMVKGRHGKFRKLTPYD